MKWTRLYAESEEGTQVIPVELSIRELKLIQNYLTKGKPLNDPSNKECMEVVIRLLSDMVDNSKIETLDTYVSNYLHETFGVEVDIDPYGENSAIELGENGLVHLSNCSNPDLNKKGMYSALVEGGFWEKGSGKLTEGFISVEDFNLVLGNAKHIGNGIKSIQLKKDGKVARLLLEFN